MKILFYICILTLPTFTTGTIFDKNKKKSNQNGIILTQMYSYTYVHLRKRKKITHIDGKHTLDEPIMHTHFREPGRANEREGDQRNQITAFFVYFYFVLCSSLCRHFAHGQRGVSNAFRQLHIIDRNCVVNFFCLSYKIQSLNLACSNKSCLFMF